VTRPGWSLIEVLLAILILGTLAALLLVGLARIREQANQLTCRHHLKGLTLAVHAYHNVRGTMPPYASGRKGELYGSWFVPLLPYLGETGFYIRFKNAQTGQGKGLRLFTDARQSPAVRGVHFPFLMCPSDPTYREDDPDATTNYLASWYTLTNAPRGPFRPAQPFAAITDGLSGTVLFAEGYSHCGTTPRLALYSSHYHNFGITPEGAPSDDPHYLPKDFTTFQLQPQRCDPWRTQTPHGAMLVSLADGSVRGVDPGIASAIWKHAIKPRDNAVLEGW
jgi:hypothetical protein